MTPQVQDDLKQGFAIRELPTRTLKMNLERETVAGRTDRLKAMEQAVYLILSIERYDYLIHSWNFGVELRDLFCRKSSGGSRKPFCRTTGLRRWTTLRLTCRSAAWCMRRLR